VKWFVSRHTKFLESELVRTRLDADVHIRRLLDEKAKLEAKIEKLELAIWPTASRAGAIYAAADKPAPILNWKPPANTYQSALQEHIDKLQAEDAKEN